MNREQEIEQLFKAFRENTISEEDYHRLMNWMKEHGSEEKVRSWMDEHWEALKKNEDPAKNDRELRFNRMIEKADKKHRIRRPEKSKIKPWYYQAAAVLAVLLSVSWIWYGTDREEVPRPFILISKHIAPGEKATITLPDGTVVRLNSDSELVFPDRFSGNTRTVALKGEAFFEVTKDKEHPFLVKTGELTTQVLGTSFNVKAYREEVEVSVATGLVEVRKGAGDHQREEKNHVLLHPSQQAIYRKGDPGFTTRKVDLDSIGVWKEGILSFRQTPLDEAAGMLERWYGVKVILKNPELKACVITGDHKNQGLASVLHSFKYTLGISYEIKDGIVTINGKKCS
ncbi:FecR family protein [Sinomicrobium oceani]|uniref:FecR family protein n=1 Tax=Sinomicrobium oceani TaxID=1150368 RepID=UPI00227C1126|nr:FecR domain-containing protein [Sinomicrobium oceani]